MFGNPKLDQDPWGVGLGPGRLLGGRRVPGQGPVSGQPWPQTLLPGLRWARGRNPGCAGRPLAARAPRAWPSPLPTVRPSRAALGVGNPSGPGASAGWRSRGWGPAARPPRPPRAAPASQCVACSARPRGSGWRVQNALGGSGTFPKAPGRQPSGRSWSGGLAGRARPGQGRHRARGGRRQQPQPQPSPTALLSSWMRAAPGGLSRGPPCRSMSSVATRTKASSTLRASLAEVSMAHRMS